MRCCVGIDLGSTTTKAILLDPEGEVVGQGITNSRSNYEVASAVARQEAHTAARFKALSRALHAGADGAGVDAAELEKLEARLKEAFREQLYRAEWEDLREELDVAAARGLPGRREPLREAFDDIAEGALRESGTLFDGSGARRSDFFRDLAAEAFVRGAERVSGAGGPPFERLLSAFDRAILDVERRVHPWDFGPLATRAAARVIDGRRGSGSGAAGRALSAAVEAIGDLDIEEVAFTGTGYGRQTLPFPKEAVRSEILCHGRGAHRVFPGTRTVLDIGGQDTKAIQVDEGGVVSGFQMNDRCAAGCGRYLGYIADELNLGLHELGPLALGAKKVVKVNSTCTVFAGAELRERLALGERREDILAGLHRSIMLRAMALLARSGGVRDQFTFTGGVCRNEMAVKVLRQLVAEHYGEGIQLNTHPDSIYMGALGAALFALDDFRAGRASVPRALRELYDEPSQAAAAAGA